MLRGVDIPWERGEVHSETQVSGRLGMFGGKSPSHAKNS